MLDNLIYKNVDNEDDFNDFKNNLVIPLTQNIFCNLNTKTTYSTATDSMKFYRKVSSYVTTVDSTTVRGD